MHKVVKNKETFLLLIILRFYYAYSVSPFSFSLKFIVI